MNNNKNSNIYKEYYNNNDSLIITFAGNGPKNNFEFFKSITKQFENKKNILMFKDPHKNWYHKGIGNNFYNIKLIKEFIQKECNSHKKVYMLGGSAGGYAALLFGSLIVHENLSVISIYPQTTLWKLKHLPKAQSFDSNYLDLLPYIKTNNTAKFNLFKNDAHPKGSLHDPFHVDRIKNLNKKNIKCFTLDENLMKFKNIRDSGKLDLIYKQIIV